MSPQRIASLKKLQEVYPDLPKAVLQRLNRIERDNRARCRKKNNKRKAAGQTDLIKIEKLNFIQICVNQEWRCALCGDPMDYNILDGHDPEVVSLEHMLGLERGGHHTRKNCKATHRRCNMDKNNKVDTPGAAECERKGGRAGSQYNKRKRRGSSSIQSKNTLSGEYYKRQKEWAKKNGRSQWAKRKF